MNERAIIQDSPELLQSMMEDMSRQTGVHQQGKYWKRYSERIVRSIRRWGLNGFRGNVGIAKGYTDFCITDPLDLLVPGSLLHRLMRVFVKMYPANFLYKKFYDLNKTQLREAEHFKSLYYSCCHSWIGSLVEEGKLKYHLTGDPTTCVKVNGYCLGDSHARALVWQKILAEQIEFGGKRVALEIGGGFVAFAHVLLATRESIRKYVYVDIPPMLYVGTQYLKAVFGESVKDYGQTRNLAELNFVDDNSLEILAICPWQVEKLNVKVDFVFNSSSFQEMPREIVANYARKIFALLAGDGDICLYVYKRRESKRVLNCQEIIDIFAEHARASLVEMPGSPDQEVVPGYYLHAGRAVSH